jgi:predicted RNA binding protein YcfA (HicA-like mRNA interferase family)
MKIPRSLTGLELIKLLKPFGYEVVRQTGSHIRIQTIQNGQHSEKFSKLTHAQRRKLPVN